MSRPSVVFNTSQGPRRGAIERLEGNLLRLFLGRGEYRGVLAEEVRQVNTEAVLAFPGLLDVVPARALELLKIEQGTCPLCNGTKRHHNFGFEEGDFCSRCAGRGRILICVEAAL